MNQETVAWLAVALLSVSALGVSATTLESSVSTDANDVIDLEYDRVPIGQDTASNALDEIEGRDRDGESATDANPDEHRQSQAASRPDPSDRQDAQQPQDSQSQRQQQRSESEEASGGLEPMSLLDRLLALLASLLQPLLALAALAAVVGLVARYRDRLLALLADPEPESDDHDDPPTDGSDRWFEGSPAHTIEGAWLGMVRRLDVEDPETMTTSECASAAIEAGLDREAVRRLTETYEEVRYGGRPVTDHREQVARQSQRRLELGGGT